ncbi:MAG TPA: bifunctional 4-hydroxy-3-methylbut-2-enyl diphosphate reductase/30S ribosomal protein S1, partial [Verrucomicrobiae bacterium]|nr:bifunctional 4-hydroxy-3-methylbut-2-enyl diphosphate reductase/30S ribosomal protein S1 [Verrucomicrobiae bacterium]
RQCDVVVVIGGANSNNTRELVATCRKHCPRVVHIQTATDLVAGWFEPGDTVGLTAGTSTPDWIIEEVARGLQSLAEAVPEARPATRVIPNTQPLPV